MPTFVSLQNQVRQQSTVDNAYEYTYWLPVISSASTIASIQNAAVANGANVSVTFTDRTDNVIMIAFSSGTNNPHGFITVTFQNDTVNIDVLTFLVQSSVSTILLFKTEEIDLVRVSNTSGVTLGIALFVRVGSLVKVPDHPCF